MELLQKKYSSINRLFILIGFVIALLSPTIYRSQVVNYVSNGSFESLSTNSASTLFNVENSWGAIDSSSGATYLCTERQPYVNAPKNSFGYQQPRTGDNYIGCTIFNKSFPKARMFPRNRLKTTLKANTTYCVKMHVVNTNNSPFTTDGYAMYLANSSIDTITKCKDALPYISPQIQYPSATFITDTLNWVAFSGTFTAIGDEKYLVIGNFKSNQATQYSLINPTYSSMIVHDIYIDDVSCIELDLPAFAGKDTSFTPGDSIFIGRPNDVGIDEACLWYKLPQASPIATTAGFWVKPVTTSTYVVVQTICGNVKRDTVTLYENSVGVRESNATGSGIKLFPVPTTDVLQIQFKDNCTSSGSITYEIIDLTSRIVQSGFLSLDEHGQSSIEITTIHSGFYVLRLVGHDNVILMDRFTISP
jgi:hypothetical protein